MGLLLIDECCQFKTLHGCESLCEVLVPPVGHPVQGHSAIRTERSANELMAILMQDIDG